MLKPWAWAEGPSFLRPLDEGVNKYLEGNPVIFRKFASLPNLLS
jgi:hypothetical protein